MFVYAGDNTREKLLDDLKRRKLENPNDSLKHQDIKKALDAADDVTKPQFSFGSLKTMFTTTRWIEPYSKQEYCVKDSVPAMTWELVDDTATISGLLCRKAIGSSIGNKYEAWYAPSIPVSVAPFQLRGLPGLLVEMTNLNNKRHLKLAALNWPYSDGFPGNVCTLANAISRQDSDALFAKEDAKAQKLLDQVRKAKELQNRE
jgi:GLPGLI family protein